MMTWRLVREFVFFRNLRGMTQKLLGIQVGFPEKTADIRIAQYESGTRTPKEDLTHTFAEVLNVSPMALNVPDIDSEIGIMHTLFALEDLQGLKIDRLDGEVCLRLDRNRGAAYISMLERMTMWQEMAEKLRNGEISKEEYDRWRYTYPAVPTEQMRQKLDDLRKQN